MTTTFRAAMFSLLGTLLIAAAILMATAEPGSAKASFGPYGGTEQTPAQQGSPCLPALHGFANADCSCDVLTHYWGKGFPPTYDLDCNHNGIDDKTEPYYLYYSTPNFSPPTASANSGMETAIPEAQLTYPQRRVPVGR